MEIDRGSMVQGFFVAALLNFVFVGVIASIANRAADLKVVQFLLLGIGLTQLLWPTPLWLTYKRSGKTESAKGVLVAGGITFLLNAGCWGIIALVANQ